MSVAKYMPYERQNASALFECLLTKNNEIAIHTRDAYAGGGKEGQEVPFILNSFHLSYLLKGHFPAFQTVWFKKIFWGESPQTPKFPLSHQETNILSVAPLEKSLKIKFYPCGGAYIYQKHTTNSAYQNDIFWHKISGVLRKHSLEFHA